MKQSSPITHGETFSITENDIQTARFLIQESIDGARVLASDQTLSPNQRETQRLRVLFHEGILSSLGMFSNHEIVKKLHEVFTSVKQLESEGRDEDQIGELIYNEFADIRTFPTLMNIITNYIGHEVERPQQTWSEILAQKIFWEMGPGEAARRINQ